MADSKKDTDNYKEYLLTRGYGLYEDFSDARNPYMRYIRKEGDLYYWVTFWNGYIFLESGKSDRSFTGRQERQACTNSAMHYRYKNILDELLIVSACSSGSKMMHDLNAIRMALENGYKQDLQCSYV